MAEKFIYLIRHGKYHEEHKNPRLVGQLDATGRAQARRVGLRLKSTRIDRLVASTMPRAIETAELIKNKSGFAGRIEQTPLLRECVPTIPPKFASVIKVPRTKVKAARLQLDQAFDTYFQRAKGKKPQHHVLVCHGNVIRFLIMKAIGANLNFWASMYINHGSVSIIRINDKGDITLLLYNNVEFMPASLKTDSGKGLMLNFW